MIVLMLVTAVIMANASIFKPPGFHPNSVSVIPDGLEEVAQGVRKHINSSAHSQLLSWLVS